MFFVPGENRYENNVSFHYHDKGGHFYRYLKCIVTISINKQNSSLISLVILH